MLVGEHPRLRLITRDVRLMIECALVWTASIALGAGTGAALVAVAIPGGWPWWHVGLVAAGITAATVLFAAFLAITDGLYL